MRGIELNCLCLSICLSVCLSVCQSVCCSACLPACLSQSVCLSVYLSVCLSCPVMWCLHDSLFRIANVSIGNSSRLVRGKPTVRELCHPTYYLNFKAGFRHRKREHITPALKNLHWLPISQRIHYKLSLLYYKSFNSLLPSYVSDLLSPYTVSRILLSTSDTTRLFVPRYRLEHYGKRAFSRYAPSVWNSLPAVLRETNTTNSFKTHLKTHLFRSI